MKSLSALRGALIALALLATAALAGPGTALAVPGERDRLNACKAMVERAAAATTGGQAGSENAELQKCRQIIKEWTLRDSRMSIDENGQPLR